MGVMWLVQRTFRQLISDDDELQSFWDCPMCRNTQSVFDACVLNNLNLERPPFDYYNQVRVHVSPRPKPPPPKPDVFPDPTPKLPDDYPREPAKYGSRFHWLN
uniref:Uncharacterized protein n=1 Tax=Timema bartmani TaxID=61472 RepID=A0A7R9EUU4_9NEOP|nr:unnamed protein product [Timema bartmani]